MFHNMLMLYGEELLAPYPTPKLEDRPLSAAIRKLSVINTISEFGS